MEVDQVKLASLRQAIDRTPVLQSNNTASHISAADQANIFVGNQYFPERKVSEADIAAKIRDTLFQSDPADDRARLISDNGLRTSNTCEWILEEQTFKQWRESSAHNEPEDRCLWISGRPGMGKTYMAIYVTEELEKTLQHGSEDLLYFFCTHQSEERRQATGIFRGLICTLLKKHQSQQFVDIVARQFDPMNKPQEAKAIQGSITALWRIFTSLIDALAELRCIQLVIDALDECDDKSFRILSANFRKLCNTYSNVKVLLFTRDSPLRHWRSIKLDQGHGERIRSDVGKFSSQVALQIIEQHELVSVDIDHFTDLLVEAAGGSFLWVGFAAPGLSMPLIKTEDELYERLSEFPEQLESVFRRILEKISPGHVKKTAAILRTVAVASRPLSVLELAAFVEADGPWQVTTRDALAAEKQTRSAIEGCVPLINISQEDSLVKIAHFSVREYLLHLEDLDLTNNSQLKAFAFNREWEHVRMAIQGLRLCSLLTEDRVPFTEDELNRLKLKLGDSAFEEGGLKLKMLQAPKTVVPSKAHLYVLFEYGISAWPIHLRQAGAFLVHALRNTAPSIDMFADGEAGQILRTCWVRQVVFGNGIGFRYYEARVRPRSDWTLLSLAVHLNIEDLLGLILAASEPVHINPMKGLGSRPGGYTEYDFVSEFCNSVSLYSVSIARKFLDFGIDVHAKCLRHGDTPLIRAIMTDNHEMIELLLSQSVNAGSYVYEAERSNQEPGRLSLLSMAAGRGSVKSVELLLNHGFEGLSTGEDPGDMPALHFAAISGHLEVIKFLLIRKFDVDLRQQQYYNMTPLMCAAESRVRTFRTALGQQIDTSSTVIGILIENGASIDAQDDRGKTALHFGVDEGNMESTRALLSRRADPNISDFSGFSPLLLAISTQPVDIQMIELLLDHQADVNARGAEGLHALGMAIVKVQVEAARTLILRGAKVNSVFRWNNNPTLPLALAITLKSKAMVDLLLESGAQLTLQVARVQSPLLLAVATGHVDIVESLLEKLPPGRSGSDLLGAAFEGAFFIRVLRGRAIIARALFEAAAGVGFDMARLNVPGALAFAAAMCDCETIEVLLEYGADINAPFKGKSVFSTINDVPFDKIPSTGRKKAARSLNFLLDHGVNDWEGGLTATAASGSTQAARAILDHERCPLKLPVSWYLRVQVRILRQIDLLYDRSLVLGRVIHEMWNVPRPAKAIVALSTFSVCYFFLGSHTALRGKTGLSLMVFARFH